VSKNNNVNPDHYKALGRERLSSSAVKPAKHPQALHRERERFLKREQKRRMLR
jgi:hypothetical protein